MKKLFTIIILFSLIFPSIVVCDEISQIIKIYVWEDGGSIGVEAKKDNGEIIKLCFDGKMETKTPGRIYLGSTYCSEESTLLDFKSVQEKEIVQMFRRYFDKLYTKEEQKYFIKHGRFDTLSKEEIKAWKILPYIVYIEKKYLSN